ncbi:hypothetical protein [Serratia marcescens]|uniref:hypothetical protein n=1 Tax=Serratia marcescens TaxID=615 RepID=UPI002880E4D8|nr:hypothetical protein [Serratia marcescens]MDT0208949.1 hypothetical protein [Serratia marcescens]
MTQPILMASYHDAILSALREIEWVANADDYPEVVTQLETPAVYLSIAGWKNAPKGTLRGPVEITDTLTVKGKTELQADTAVTGDLSATGDISDGKSTLARVREIFNMHTHPDPHGGNTEKPNNQM